MNADESYPNLSEYAQYAKHSEETAEEAISALAEIDRLRAAFTDVKSCNPNFDVTP